MPTLIEELAKPQYATLISDLDTAEAAIPPLLSAVSDAEAALAAAVSPESISTCQADLDTKVAAAQVAINTATQKRQAIADLINSQTVQKLRPIPGEDVQRYLMVVQKWPKLEALARGLISGTDNEILTAVGLVSALATLKSFDFSVPAYKVACQANLAACVALGLFDQTHRDAIENMANTQSPLWQDLGFQRPLDHGDILKARA